MERFDGGGGNGQVPVRFELFGRDQRYGDSEAAFLASACSLAAGWNAQGDGQVG